MYESLKLQNLSDNPAGTYSVDEKVFSKPVVRARAGNMWSSGIIESPAFGMFLLVPLLRVSVTITHEVITVVNVKTRRERVAN